MTRHSKTKKTTEADPIPEALRARVRIENVRPQVDGGRFPVKRVVGETVEVTAEVFADGHDELLVQLLYQREGDSSWSARPMKPDRSDRFQGDFEVSALSPYRYAVEAWIDRFGTWSSDLEKKHAADQPIESELLEGAAMVRDAARRAPDAERSWLEGEAGRLEGPGDVGARVESALSKRLAEAMLHHADRGDVARSEPLPVLVERERARTGAWYEMFPRSAGSKPGRSATLREAEARLPEIAAMGFDVLYLPPIHPIGESHRKGPNNTLSSGPEDPGSPWAIGSKAGGHKAVDPNLGTLEDFEHFVAAARDAGLEIALDVAFQCSPDHPYVREHPEWFRKRPDGSIKHAENPPKKYQDIYPLDFECEQWRELWSELRSVVLFWVERGVRVFRVDNPHTKSFGFWEWMIGEVRREYPDTVFLSEAFTRPPVLRHLAKAGFSQSYTYFTWRNTKEELTDYLTELTQSDTAEYLRPNLFANTPDILHEYLQFGGRAAFQIRIVLAATLGASYGIYGPAYELCEARAVPGTEEYLDSEKYQVRHWDLERHGNLRSFIGRVNRIRRENAALHRNVNLRFLPVDNEQVLFYGKTTTDGENQILVVANLDPYHVQSGWVEVPLEDLGIESEGSFQAHELLGDARYLWHGSRNFVRLDPKESPAQIFRLRRKVRTERDFDYFL